MVQIAQGIFYPRFVVAVFVFFEAFKKVRISSPVKCVFSLSAKWFFKSIYLPFDLFFTLARRQSYKRNFVFFKIKLVLESFMVL